MKIQALHPNFQLPTKGSDRAGGYDLYMPDDGVTGNAGVTTVNLGFAAEVPAGYVALLLPRSSAGGKYGLELNNTCGVIDADYRGEWIAKLKTKQYERLSWKAGDRLLQYLLVPVLDSEPQLVEALSVSQRGEGGFGSSGGTAESTPAPTAVPDPASGETPSPKSEAVAAEADAA
jgi:dUTP pyrophosphatase